MALLLVALTAAVARGGEGRNSGGGLAISEPFGAGGGTSATAPPGVPAGAGAIASPVLEVGSGSAVASTPSTAARGSAHGHRCTETRAGGRWPALNADLRNTRHQPDEHVIGVDNVAQLAPAWSFSGREVGATGGMRSTPVVAGGCVYLALGQGYLGDRGDVIALDVDTGELVWHVQLKGSVLGLAVADGLVYATPSLGTRGEVKAPVVTDTYQPAGSYVVALDASTGRIRWTSDRLDDGNANNGTFINASPVVFRGGDRRMVFVPLSGGAGDGAKVPMYFLDARNGRTIKKAYSLSEAEYEEGYGGTGIWSTAAVDEATGYLYAATADSDGRTRQHRKNNAILRIDVDPRRPTFAAVVGVHSGTSEHGDLDFLVGHPNNPACGALGPEAPAQPPTFFDTSAAPECLEFDVDFGASPNLSTDAAGALVVTALQKSGVFHVVDAASMKPKWTSYVGPGGPAMHAATAAVGSDRFFVGASPNLVFGFDRDDPRPAWVSSTDADLFAYQPLTLANGVLYTINDRGNLVGLQAADGARILHRELATDGGFTQCLGVGAGVAVAHRTVFAPCDAGGPADLAGLPSDPGGIVAYRLG